MLTCPQCGANAAKAALTMGRRQELDKCNPSLCQMCATLWNGILAMDVETGCLMLAALKPLTLIEKDFIIAHAKEYEILLVARMKAKARLN